MTASFWLANASSAWEVTSIACRSESTFDVSKQTDSRGEQMFGEIKTQVTKRKRFFRQNSPYFLDTQTVCFRPVRSGIDCRPSDFQRGCIMQTTVDQTRGAAAGKLLTNCPKSVHNPCIIELFGGVFVLWRCFYMNCLLVCGLLS